MTFPVFKDVNYNHHISLIQSAVHFSTFLCTSLDSIAVSLFIIIHYYHFYSLFGWSSLEKAHCKAGLLREGSMYSQAHISLFNIYWRVWLHVIRGAEKATLGSKEAFFNAGEILICT